MYLQFRKTHFYMNAFNIFIQMQLTTNIPQRAHFAYIHMVAGIVVIARFVCVRNLCQFKRGTAHCVIFSCTQSQMHYILIIKIHSIQLKHLNFFLYMYLCSNAFMRNGAVDNNNIQTHSNKF